VGRTHLIRKSPTTMEQQAGTTPNDGALLAAALAATLVEYQRHVRENHEVDSTETAANSWRLLGCLDRMRGSA
jgi:hypothetical protein